MPDGVMQWFDPTIGEGRIVRGGRRYTAVAEATEPVARTPGARVHFDIDHSTPGANAVNVRLREGTRVARSQHRFGDLSGSATPDSKGTAPFARAHPEWGRDLVRHPVRVVQRWASAITDRDLDGAMVSYAPSAVLHVGSDVAVGRSAILGRIEQIPFVGVAVIGDVLHRDGRFIVRWPRIGPESHRYETALLIEHGEIAEQWIETTWSECATETSTSEITVSSTGSISVSARQTAIDKISEFLDAKPGTFSQVHLRLELNSDPTRARPLSMRLSAAVDDHPIRAAVTGESIVDATDRLTERLRRRLEQLASHRLALRRRGATSGPGEWRHGDWATHSRSPRRPSGTSEIVRHKSFTTTEDTVDEALYDMESMDYDFLLFTDLATGVDAVVTRRRGLPHRLQFLDSPEDDSSPASVVPIDIVAAGAPALTVEAAREHLDLGVAERIFFKDPDSGRGHVLYVRLDGHYGLISPADVDAGSPHVDVAGGENASL